MAAKKTTKTLSKSDFIRHQPSTLSAAGVVAKAKSEGIQIDPALVYKVRGRAAAKRGKASSVPTAKPAASKEKAVNKAAFIRSLPASMPVKDVVAKARAEGIKIADTYVYWARGSARKKAPKQAASGASAPRNGGAVSRPVTTSSFAENLLRALAAEIGLGRAIEILAGERARVRAVIGG